MYTSKHDGKKFGNDEMGKHYDKTREPESKPAMDKGGKEGKEGEHEDMKEVVAEHGPATKMEMHSHHEDGHVHKAEHHDHESASKHVDHAFGEEPAGNEDGMDKPAGDEMGAFPGGGIPGMH